MCELINQNLFFDVKVLLLKDYLKILEFNKIFIIKLIKKIFFNNKSKTDNYVISTQNCMFILSVGTLLTEHYDPVYKLLGINLFNILLNNSNEVIKKLNIHEVIYTTAFPELPKVNEERLITSLCGCLYKCFELNSKTNISDWNQFDDLIEATLQKIAFTSDHKITTRLLFFISKLSAINVKESTDEFTDYDGITENIKNCQELVFTEKLLDSCKDNQIAFRWTKKLLQLYTSAGDKLFGNDENDVLLNIYAIHINYLVNIFSVPLNIIDVQQFVKFLKAFSNIIFAVLYQKHENLLIVKGIHSIVQTLLKHIENNKEDGLSESIASYGEAFKLILKNTLFEKCRF